MPKHESWGDVFHAALRQGDDHGAAAYKADNWLRERSKERIGERVLVTADNHGGEATIIAYRISLEDAPASHYKVRMDGDGQEFWAFDHEVSVIERPDSGPDTRDHIQKVRARLDEIVTNLQRRGWEHDGSKLREPEKSGYDQLTHKLKDLVYGSDEYRAALKEAGPVIAHHYAHNSHHPEFWPVPESEEIDHLIQDIKALESVPLDPERWDAKFIYDHLAILVSVRERLHNDLTALKSRINGMSLLDITEMLTDHKGASERTKQGSIEQSLEHNRTRFGYSDQLYNIFKNTIRELKW